MDETLIDIAAQISHVLSSLFRGTLFEDNTCSALNCGMDVIWLKGRRYGVFVVFS
jgi:hypothetical protein